jgi:hypothetical protein
MHLLAQIHPAYTVSYVNEENAMIGAGSVITKGDPRGNS